MGRLKINRKPRPQITIRNYRFVKPTVRMVCDIYKYFHPHTRGDSARIVRAFKFAAKKHSEQIRKSGDPYIIHPLDVAIEAARKGLGVDVIIAAILHDVIEDCNVTYKELRRLFGVKVADLVAGTTKPKLVAGEWIYADDDRYYTSVDEYGKELHMVRARVYYKRIMNSGDAELILLKLFDNLSNLRTMEHLPRAKRDRNIAKMLGFMLWTIPKIFHEYDLADYVRELRRWGFDLDVEPTIGREILVMGPRSGFGESMLEEHPTVGRDYGIVYVDGDLDGAGEFELGIASSRTTDLEAVDVVQRLFPEAQVKGNPSMVPERIGLNEVVVSVSSREAYARGRILNRVDEALIELSA